MINIRNISLKYGSVLFMKGIWPENGSIKKTGSFNPFQVLYSLLTFGIDRNEVYNLLDPPEDMMRLRLICTVLDTCGAYFVSGSSKAKLKFFLAYFELIQEPLKQINGIATKFEFANAYYIWKYFSRILLRSFNRFGGFRQSYLCRATYSVHLLQRSLIDLRMHF